MERNNISYNIQKILIKKNITISELAEKMNLTKQRVSYILLNKEDKNWKVSNLMLFASTLEMDFKDFLMEVLFNG